MCAAPVNWKDVPERQVAVGPMQGRWRDLGTAAGTRRLGLRRIQVAPGGRSTPAHTHSGEEEVFFVLAGSGLSWQGGETSTVAAGDCLVHRIEGPAHTLIAGPGGLDVLAFSDRCVTEACYLPRAGVAWLGSSWVKAGDTPHPFAQEAAAGELELGEPGGRPASIVNLEDVPAQDKAHGDCACADSNVGAAAGAERTALRHFAVRPGMLALPPHCHSVVEELFVVLEGDGAYLEQEAGAAAWRPEQHPVKAGDCVAALGATGVPHAFRAGPAGLTYLAFSDRTPGDTVWYPRSRKIAFKGLGIIGRLEPLAYWDGED